MKSDNILLQTLEKRYYTEIDLREKLESRLSAPLTIIALELGFLSLLLQNLPELSFQLYHLAFFILLCVALALFIFAVVYLFLFMTGQRFAYIADPKEIFKYSEDYLAYLKAMRVRSPQAALDRQMETFLIVQYRRYGQFDVDANQKRTRRLLNLKRFIILSLIALFIAYIPYGIISVLEHHEKIQKVELVGHP